MHLVESTGKHNEWLEQLWLLEYINFHFWCMARLSDTYSSNSSSMRSCFDPRSDFFNKLKLRPGEAFIRSHYTRDWLGCELCDVNAIESLHHNYSNFEFTHNTFTNCNACVFGFLRQQSQQRWFRWKATSTVIRNDQITTNELAIRSRNW